jgi:LCP family protein required for cell wall assembly
LEMSEHWTPGEQPGSGRGDSYSDGPDFGAHRHGAPRFDDIAPWTPASPDDLGDGADPDLPGSDGPVGHRRRAARKKKSRRRRIAKWTSLSLAAVLVLVTAFAGYWWWRLNHNIHVSSLHASMNSIKTMPEHKDQFGHTAMNILVIGTDARETQADCNLGGDCAIGDSNGGNADVEMILHLSADRSNLDVISIPRDTYTNIPSCKTSTGGVSQAYFGMINSALQNSTGCQVDAVEQLTGLQIDHFMQVDFNGVVQITDAVGGVPICTNQPVNDPYSGLNLPAGTTTVKGVTALELLRSRHGFGDGSDLERESVQHIYLSSLVRKIKANANLTDWNNLLGIADTATKSLTVDPGLDSIIKLASLAEDMKGVPTDRIEFLTMPTVAYGAHLKPDTATDQQLFTLVNNDQSLTAAPPAPKTPAAKPAQTHASTPTLGAPPTNTEAASNVHSVLIDNGTTANGRAGELQTELRNDGVPTVTCSASRRTASPRPPTATAVPRCG